MRTALTTAQLDRAAGVLLGMASGDALGAGYEFGPPLADDAPVSMGGGGTFGWEPGEWTDDTSMAIAIAEVTARGADLLRLPAQDQVAARWSEWVRDAKDVGNQTRAVLGAARARAGGRGAGAPTAADLAEAAQAHDARTGRSGGNGSLMRTAPVALAFLEDPDGLVRAAGRLSALTHADPEAGEACALWCLAIRHAVLHGDLDGLRAGLGHLPADRAAVWSQRLDDAEASRPADFAHNGWVVQALQGAWSAISTTRPAGATAYRDAAVPAEVAQGGAPWYAGAAHLRAGTEAAVRGGRDTDTVAAIAGALLGATHGASAVPAEWRRILHGWPGRRGRDLVALGLLTARGGHPDRAGWPTAARVDYGAFGDLGALARHPHDERVWLGGADALDHLPAGVDAVVSLCRLGAGQVPARGVAPENHVEVWLVDHADPASNPNLDFVLHDAAATVAGLRDEGRTVLLHCVQGMSRTPTVAAAYGARLTGRPPLECLDQVLAVLPHANPNHGMRAALRRLT